MSGKKGEGQGFFLRLHTRNIFEMHNFFKIKKKDVSYRCTNADTSLLRAYFFISKGKSSYSLVGSF